MVCLKLERNSRSFRKELYLISTMTLPFGFIWSRQAILRLWLKGERRVFDHPTPRVGEVAQEIAGQRGGGIVVMYRELDTLGEQQMRTGFQLKVSTVSRGSSRAPGGRSWRASSMSLSRLCDSSVTPFSACGCSDNGPGGVRCPIFA